jgi:hypothetical protein
MDEMAAMEFDKEWAFYNHLESSANYNFDLGKKSHVTKIR